MESFIIEGERLLRGELEISGSKNAALPMLAATLLTNNTCTLRKVPKLSDVETMMRLLQALGKNAYFEGDTLVVEHVSEESFEAPYDMVSRMRASVAVMGPLVARRGYARISLPGGCSFGPRPIDLHIKGLQSLSADVTITHGFIVLRSTKLKGDVIDLSGKFGPSVLGTENIMMAACLAEGTTIIEGAAREPEVQNLAEFLRHMGASIEGDGTSVITIRGVDQLHGAGHTVIPDRIEAGSFLSMGALLGDPLLLSGLSVAHLKEPITLLQNAGADLEVLSESQIRIKKSCLKGIEVDTMPYPFFPTDLQAPFSTALALAEGVSVVSEKIYPERFAHVAELARMGANISIDNAMALIHGVPKLSGAVTQARDLRCGIALVIAALAAEGKSEVRHIYHIDRGYEGLDRKLLQVGATIERVQDQHVEA